MDTNNANGDASNANENPNSTNEGNSDGASGAAEKPDSLFETEAYKNATPEQQRDMVIEQNRRLYARNQKAKNANEDGTNKPGTVPSAEKKPQTSTPQNQQVLSVTEVLQLRSEGFTEKEILAMQSEAQDLNVPISKLLANPTFKQGIEARRKATKVQQTTPGATTRSIIPPKDGKTFAQMNEAERRKAFEERSASRVNDNE